MTFNDFICSTNRTHKNLSKSINEHKFSLLSFMFSFTLNLPTLVNILKTTVANYAMKLKNIRINFENFPMIRGDIHFHNCS
jgi:hypothetical protein